MPLASQSLGSPGQPLGSQPPNELIDPVQRWLRFPPAALCRFMNAANRKLLARNIEELDETIFDGAKVTASEREAVW